MRDGIWYSDDDEDEDEDDDDDDDYDDDDAPFTSTCMLSGCEGNLSPSPNLLLRLRRTFARNALE